MPKAHINSVALLATVAAVGILLVYAVTGNHGFSYETTIGGLVLLLILFAYDEEGYRSLAQGLAFSAVAGFCAMLGAAYPEIQFMQPKSPEQWTAFTWLGTTLLFFAVDRLRASSIESTGISISAQPPAQAPIRFAPAPPPPPPTPAIRYAAAPPPIPAQPVFYQAPLPVTEPVQEYVAPAPTFNEREPIPAAAPPEPSGPAAVAIAPIPPGREALIFLNLLGEGLNVLRSVRAEHLGRDYYRIADIMPENEHWQYEPGQVVRARKKALSNGKQLVAFEEAPRAV